MLSRTSTSRPLTLTKSLQEAYDGLASAASQIPDTTAAAAKATPLDHIEVVKAIQDGAFKTATMAVLPQWRASDRTWAQTTTGGSTASQPLGPSSATPLTAQSSQTSSTASTTAAEANVAELLAKETETTRRLRRQLAEQADSIAAMAMELAQARSAQVEELKAKLEKELKTEPREGA